MTERENVTDEILHAIFSDCNTIDEVLCSLEGQQQLSKWQYENKYVSFKEHLDDIRSAYTWALVRVNTITERAEKEQPAAMKQFTLRYENMGECLYQTVATSLNAAIRHFHEDVGFYHINSIVVQERRKNNENKHVSSANEG